MSNPTPLEAFRQQLQARIGGPVATTDPPAPPQTPAQAQPQYPAPPQPPAQPQPQYPAPPQPPAQPQPQYPAPPQPPAQPQPQYPAPPQPPAQPQPQYPAPPQPPAQPQPQYPAPPQPPAPPPDNDSDEGSRRKRSTARDKAERDGVELYIDCAPVGSQYRDKISMPKYEDVSARIYRINAHIAEQYNVPHWRMIDHGQGKGVFLAAVQYDLETNVPTTALYVDTSCSDHKEALGVLAASAKMVYRSTK